MPMNRIAESLDALSAETAQLRNDLAETRAELHAQTQEAQRQTANTRIGIGLVVLLLACTIAAAFQVSLENSRAIAENNLRWCPVVAPLAPRPGDPPPQGTPAQVERSLRIRVAFTNLVHDFGCDSFIDTPATGRTTP